MVENDFPISYSISSQGGQSALALELRPRGAHSGLPAPHANTVRSISQYSPHARITAEQV